MVGKMKRYIGNNRLSGSSFTIAQFCSTFANNFETDEETKRKVIKYVNRKCKKNVKLGREWRAVCSDWK